MYIEYHISLCMIPHITTLYGLDYSSCSAPLYTVHDLGFNGASMGQGLRLGASGVQTFAKIGLIRL